jgi:DNA/RNA endonuclease YhcR with UshA esterase domain
VFGVDTAAIKPQPGARVRVIGRMIAFNDELEIIQPTVTSIGTAAVPSPRPVFGSQINAFLFQGELARAENVTVVSVATGTSSSYDVRVRDISGTEFVVRVAGIGANNIPRTFWTVGNTYNVVGILNRFRTTAQLAPRSPADVTAGIPVQTIASVKTQPIGTRVTVAGVATVGASATAPFGARTFYIQDATSGAMIFFSPSASAVVVNAGDSVRVSGVVNAFSGEFEVDTAQVTTLRTGATIPAPRVVTGAQIAARTFEGELVRTNDVEIVTVPTGTGTTFTVVARAADGTEFQVRIANANTGITRSNFTVGARYDLIGILGSFNGTAQLKPRTTADIIPR